MANQQSTNQSRADVRPVEALALGTKLHNQRFAVGKVLGRGGFGISYMGRDHQLDRLVAIKELFPTECLRHDLRVVPSNSFSAAELNEARQKFLSEARTLARFHHDGIVQVFDCFEENDTAYLVMEYLQGQTLQHVVDERGALPLDEALRFVSFLGEALQEVHQAHIIHRDIKPENIILCAAPANSQTPISSSTPADARVVLIDFGLNKQVAAPSSYGTQQLTRTTALGSPGYAAPEQYGHGAQLGTWTDLYGLGATLYFLLTGNIPSSAVERINQPLLPVHALNPQIPPFVSDAIAGAMAMNTAQRPAGVDTWLQMLTAAPQPSAPAPSNPQTPYQATTVLSPTGTSAASPAAPLQNANAALEIRVSARVLFWPLLCACCGQPNQSISKAVQTNRQGQRYIRAEVNDWNNYRDDFHCAACCNHFQLREEVQRKTQELDGMERQASTQLATLQQQSSGRIGAEEQQLAQSREAAAKARQQLQAADGAETNIGSALIVGGAALGVGTVLFSSLIAGLLTAGMCVVAGEIRRVLNASQRKQARIEQAQQQLAACEQRVLALQQQIGSSRQQEDLQIKRQEAALRQTTQNLQRSLSHDQQQMTNAMRATCTCDDAAQCVSLVSSYGAQHSFRFTNSAFAREFETLNHEKLIYTT